MRDFSDLTFEDFRKLALDTALSDHEKVGFPNEYRDGKIADIFKDVVSKAPFIAAEQHKKILEIWPGCGPLPRMLIELSLRNGHKLHLVDSREMLNQLGPHESVVRYFGKFPDAMGEELKDQATSFDFIVAYSVLQYMVTDGDLWRAFDAILELLAPGGVALLADLPNVSMRRRFLESSEGLAFRDRMEQQPWNSKPDPSPEENKINDALVIEMLHRGRQCGFHCWVVPQADRLPMQNRREDLLIKRPK